MNFDSKFLNSSVQFSKELYQQTIDGKNENVVISPVSILSGLGFLMFGASGKTFDEMKKSFRFDEISDEDIEKSFQLLTKKFSSGGLSLANKIYLMKDYSIKPKFKEIAIRSFQSEVEAVDFGKNVEVADNINEWVESKTNNTIKNFIKSDSLNSETKCVLVNSIYFRGFWVDDFNPESNFKGPFYLNEDDTVEVEYMKQKARFSYAELDDLDATAIKMPYKDSDVSMLIILPNSKTGLSALESKLNEINIQTHFGEMRYTLLYVTIPKFKIEFDVDLEEPLRKMGMETIFSDGAEFGNLLDPVKPIQVSKVIHKAFIEVNEQGTEAGGSTALGVNLVRRPGSFKADRSFLFALIDDSKFLFIGRKVK